MLSRKYIVFAQKFSYRIKTVYQFFSVEAVMLPAVNSYELIRDSGLV